MPRAVVYGPTDRGGMQWETPHSILLASRLTMLVGSVRLNDVVGQMITIQLEWLQLPAGIGIQVLEAKCSIPYLPVGWLKNLHDLVVDAGIQVHMTNLWTATSRRENDQIVMDYVQHHFPSWMWGNINQCRLYLQVVVFSDLTHWDGQKIPNKCHMVEQPVRQSLLDFPFQIKPTKDAIKHWQYFIRHITDDKLNLLTPFGKWEENPYQQYPFVMDKHSNLLYCQVGQNQ